MKKGLMIVVGILFLSSFAFVMAVDQEVVVVVLNGTDIGNESYDPLCVFENEDIILSADVDFMDCLGDVWVSVKVGSGNWTNYTVDDEIDSNYYFTLSNVSLNPSETVQWQYFAEDCYNFTYNGSLNDFYVNSKANLIVDPVIPNGDNGWYVTEPEFSLVSNDSSEFFYRWDSEDNLVYSGPFGLENIPNAPPLESAGTLDLHYWSSVTCGNDSEQESLFYVDLMDPLITNLSPGNNSVVYNNLRPPIYVYLDEIYQSNSGINPNSVIMKLNGVEVDPDVVDADTIDMTASYTPDFDLVEGIHNVSVYVEDNAGRSSELVWEFEIVLTGIFDINIHSPIDGVIYDSKRVLFNLTTSEDVVKIEYIDWNLNRPRWKTLCRNCDKYGLKRKKTKNFKDGDNSISIRATDEFGFARTEDFSFFIDSKKPKISRTYPRRNALTNGDEFRVKYTETNLEGVKLFYGIKEMAGIVEDIRNVSLENCSAGRNQECAIKLGLAELDDFNGEWIVYWFEVEDSINVVQSKEVKVEVDNVAPVLNNDNPVGGENGSFWYQGVDRKSRYIYFSFNVTEENFDEVGYTYIDSRGKERTRRLCSRLKDGICETKKSFRKGYYELNLLISDDAGNKISTAPVNFTII